MKQESAQDSDIRIYTPPQRRIGQPPAFPQNGQETDETLSVWRPGSSALQKDVGAGLIQ